ncbi:sugar O-acyltransferase, sialic acid O-acetyltransferase NeuD family [Natronincola peptidivorans]|uniref:Sugar O-acyltransferase, sialic acid O-acetyltransferase NeuD family n=1 Tax=Natronincola peptidivorans TaxID=426128 RepID=A0A1H9ZUQ2_9FIRM|nr:hypothetical protein [Natronincola peptidivorans]SES84569.1 sugar O-acyltransferase, sialic acid O-acetyltransferase NeuD family [Natronincola peptidivorans]
MKLWKGLPTVIFGTGSTSKEVVDFIDDINNQNHENVFDVLGYVSESKKEIGTVLNKKEIITWDETFKSFAKNFPLLGVIIPFGKVEIKMNILKKIQLSNNIVFPNIIHPKAILNKDRVHIGIGNIIYPGVVCTSDIHIGNFNTINMNVTIGHDVKIGNYNVINPVTAISGNVLLENEISIGTGSSIAQGIKIGEKAFIAMGSAVIENVEKGEQVSGNFATDHRNNLKKYMEKKLKRQTNK